MSGSASITVRKTKNGKRYHVRFRIGGRAHPVQHAGSFKTEREAKERLRFVSGELAAGRDPRAALRELQDDALQTRRTLDEWFGAFIESRVDVSAKTVALYRNSRSRLGLLADRDPFALRPSDIQDWIAANSDLAAKSVGHYLGSLRLVLDYADVEPNPARNRKVKLPASVGEEIHPPSRSECDKIRVRLLEKNVLPVRLIEATALRVSEAVELTYGDVDFAENRLRISKARTKGKTAGQRWLPVPPALMDEIAELCPLEDRDRDRRVFRDLTDHGLRGALRSACKLAGVAHYHPHDFRHRRISLWFAHGIDPLTIKTWAGHSRASMSSDIYGHVLVSSDDEWCDFWLGIYASERAPKAARVAPVWSQEEPES